MYELYICNQVPTNMYCKTSRDISRCIPKKKICEDDSKGMALYNIKNMKIKIDPP